MKNSIKKLLIVTLCMTLGLGTISTAMAAEKPLTKQEVAQALSKVKGAVFPIGDPNINYAKYFTGDTWLAPLTDSKVGAANVTFVNGAHTYWHIHHKICQVLICGSGDGYYQIWGQAPQKLAPGMTVTIPADTKHWHGAAPGKMFQHISIAEQVEGASTEWLEPVNEKDFSALK